MMSGLVEAQVHGRLLARLRRLQHGALERPAADLGDLDSVLDTAPGVNGDEAVTDTTAEHHGEVLEGIAGQVEGGAADGVGLDEYTRLGHCRATP